MISRPDRSSLLVTRPLTFVTSGNVFRTLVCKGLLLTVNQGITCIFDVQYRYKIPIIFTVAETEGFSGDLLMQSMHAGTLGIQHEKRRVPVCL